MRVIVCGSAHRTGSRGWTDAIALRRFLLAIRAASPTIIHGASHSKGADHLVDAEAEALGILRDPYPVESDLDGYGRSAPIRRNSRMIAESFPQVGAAFVIGNVGEAVGTKGHYLTNGSDHIVNLLRSHGRAVVVYRENGIEPCRDLAEARDVLGCLWRANLYREDVERAGKAVRDAAQGPEAVIAARAAVEALRVARPTLAPWLAPVEMTLQ